MRGDAELGQDNHLDPEASRRDASTRIAHVGAKITSRTVLKMGRARRAAPQRLGRVVKLQARGRTISNSRSKDSASDDSRGLQPVGLISFAR